MSRFCRIAQLGWAQGASSMAVSNSHCPECAAVLQEAETCRQHFEALLFLEYEIQETLAPEIHQLMVACYTLQHNQYSDEARPMVIKMIEDVLERGVTAAETRRRNKNVVDSGKRKFHITGPSTPAPHIDWPITIHSIDANDGAAYAESVRRWAQSILDTVRAQAQS